MGFSALWRHLLLLITPAKTNHPPNLYARNKVWCYTVLAVALYILLLWRGPITTNKCCRQRYLYRCINCFEAIWLYRNFSLCCKFYFIWICNLSLTPNSGLCRDDYWPFLVYVCVCVCVCVCMYLCICVCVCMCVSTYVRMYVSMYGYVSMYVYQYIFSYYQLVYNEYLTSLALFKLRWLNKWIWNQPFNLLAAANSPKVVLCTCWCASLSVM